MPDQGEQTQRKIPVAIHLIAFLYVMQAAFILMIFIYTRTKVSPSLIRADAITLSLLPIPLIAMYSVYRPRQYMRWFPLFGIPFNWLIGFGLGRLLGVVWLLDAAVREVNDTVDLIMGGVMTLSALILLTLWMLFAFLPLRFTPSARRYIFSFSKGL